MKEQLSILVVTMLILSSIMACSQNVKQQANDGSTPTNPTIKKIDELSKSDAYQNDDKMQEKLQDVKQTLEAQKAKLPTYAISKKAEVILKEANGDKEVVKEKIITIGVKNPATGKIEYAKLSKEELREIRQNAQVVEIPYEEVFNSDVLVDKTQ